MNGVEGVHEARPLILIRGFGGLGTADERRVAYQGFNDGTVYPQKRGENYIYEGLVLRFLKARRWRYQDATTVVGYYRSSQAVRTTAGFFCMGLTRMSEPILTRRN